MKDYYHDYCLRIALIRKKHFQWKNAKNMTLSHRELLQCETYLLIIPMFWGFFGPIKQFPKPHQLPHSVQTHFRLPLHPAARTFNANTQRRAHYPPAISINRLLAKFSFRILRVQLPADQLKYIFFFCSIWFIYLIQNNIILTRVIM